MRIYRILHRRKAPLDYGGAIRAKMICRAVASLRRALRRRVLALGRMLPSIEIEAPKSPTMPALSELLLLRAFMPERAGRLRFIRDIV